MKRTLLSVMIAFATAAGLQAQTIVSTTAELEQALSIATSGTQIWVQAGIYEPTATLIVPEGVKLYGGFTGTETSLLERDWENNPTVLDGQNQFGFVLLKEAAEVNGFTIQNGFAQAPNRNGGGVYAEANTTIENCSIVNNRAALNGGGLFARGDIFIIGSVIKNNTAIYGPSTFGSCLYPTNSEIEPNPPPPEEPVPSCELHTVSGVTRASTAPLTNRQNSGDFSTLSVTAGGDLPLTYQWYKTTNAVATGGSAVGMNSAFYTPTSAIVEQVRYYVVVTNSCGSVTSAVSAVHGVVTSLPSLASGCGTAALTFTLGTPYFKTDRTWRVGNQIWSDVVLAPGCNKITYNGTVTDCRVTGASASPAGRPTTRRTSGYNDGYHGDVFTWCLVQRFQTTLCPSPWRVPSAQDFVTLTNTLAAADPADAVSSSTTVDRLLNQHTTTTTNTIRNDAWGGSFGGLGGTAAIGTQAWYWSLARHETETMSGLGLVFLGGTVYPQYNAYSTQARMLRCVRNP